MDSNLNPKLGDFGLATPPTSASDSLPRNVLIPLSHAAPERFDGVCSPKTDVYALGVAMWEMLCWRNRDNWIGLDRAGYRVDSELVERQVKEGTPLKPDCLSRRAFPHSGIL